MSKKLLALSDAVSDRLEQEPNQSALVDVLLAVHYGIELPKGEAHLNKRHEILEDLGFEGEEDDTDLSNLVVAQPLPDEGKPLDSIVAPEKHLHSAPSVKISVMGRPADQTEAGELVYTDETCPTCGREMIAGICVDCI